MLSLLCSCMYACVWLDLILLWVYTQTLYIVCTPLQIIYVYVCLNFAVAEVSIGFMESSIVVSEPANFTVSVVLFEDNLDPGTEISISFMGIDGIATSM